MTRYLTILGVALAAVVAWATLSTTDAGAVEEETTAAYYVAEEIEVEETAAIDGEQIGSATTMTIGSLPALTCSSIEYDGEAANTGAVSEAPVKISPEYSTCHVISPLLGTRTATVTTNGCIYEVEPTVTVTESEVTHYLGDLDITCPAEKSIEIHIYNTSNAKDEGASTLCTFAIAGQTNLSGTTLTNTEEDLVADFNVGSIKVTRTGGSEALCGAASQNATYKGEATLQATNEAAEFVAVQSAGAKEFNLGQAGATVIGDENGLAEFTTEKKAVKCTTVKYEATPKARLVGELTITPTYSNCSFGTLTAHVDFKTCKYYHTLIPGFIIGPTTTATLKIVCQNGDKITITATNEKKETTCTITYGEQEATGLVDLKNSTTTAATGDPVKWWVKFTNTLTGLKYEVSGDPDTCGKNQLLEGGTLHGSLDVRAYSDAKKTTQKGMRVIGSLAHNKAK